MEAVGKPNLSGQSSTASHSSCCLPCMRSHCQYLRSRWRGFAIALSPLVDSIDVVRGPSIFSSAWKTVAVSRMHVDCIAGIADNLLREMDMKLFLNTSIVVGLFAYSASALAQSPRSACRNRAC